MATVADAPLPPPPPFYRPLLRLRHWWQLRVKPAERWTLSQRTIYIVPTGAGLVFGVTLVVMLLASINYQLNLGYVLTFLLAGSGLASMNITHRNLSGIELHLRPVQPVFAGEAAAIEVVLTEGGAGDASARPHRQRSRARWGLGLRWLPGNLDETAPPTLTRQGGDPWVWVDLVAGGSSSAHLTHITAHRGWNTLPVMQLESRFPLGLFRAWTVWRPATQVLAYPQPEANPPPLPTPSSQAHHGVQRAQADDAAFDGIRPYRRGDGLRQVVWKKMARTGELVSRDAASPTGDQVWLDLALAGSPEREARISRVTAWVLAAEAHSQHSGLQWGLRLGTTVIDPSAGAAHERAALQALALL